MSYDPEYAAAYYLRNREQFAKRSKAWRERNPDRFRAQQRSYRERLKRGEIQLPETHRGGAPGSPEHSFRAAEVSH